MWRFTRVIKSARFVAEEEGRHLFALEQEIQYIAASSFRFIDENVDDAKLTSYYNKIMNGESLRIISTPTQLSFSEKVFTH